MDEIFRRALMHLRGLWHQRALFIVVAWIVGGLAFVAVLATPERYEAAARIFANTDSILKPLMTGLAVQPNDEQRIAMLSRVVVSRPNVEQIVKQVGLDQEATSKDDYEKIIDRVVKSIQIKGSGRDNVYTLSFRDFDPNRAKKVIELFAQLFVSSSEVRKSEDTQSAKKFIDEQIGQYEKKLQEAENRLKAFRLRYLGLTPGEGKDHYLRMTETREGLNKAQLELHEAENARDAYRKRLESIEQGEAGAVTDTGVSITADIDTRIDSQRRTLDSLLQKYTEAHPDVAGAKRTIRELEDQRRQLLASRGTVRSSSAPPMSFGPGAVRASESLKVQVAQSEALVASLRVRVADFAQRFAKLQEAATLMPQVEAEYAQLNRDYDVNKKNYESLVTRRESATISGDMQSAGGAEFRMIDPPRVSPGPVFPNRRVLIPLALILALGAGAAAAFIAKEVRPSFFDSRAVREGTGLPVLGTVSLVETDARRSKRRRAVMRFAGATGMLVALYVVGFIALELLRDHAT